MTAFSKSHTFVKSGQENLEIKEAILNTYHILLDIISSKCFSLLNQEQ